VPCFHPLHGYRARTVNPSGKRSIVFSSQEGFVDLPVSLPCGQCVGCRLERSRQWAVRCVHEASLYDRNCFITLTYSDEFLPHGGSLDKRAFPLFMKRLRKRFSGETIRYFHCGEYGDCSGRPHYHACVFGFDFPDKYVWSVRSGFPVWRSAILERLWKFGQSEIGSVTFESAAYVARYIMKKVTGVAAEQHYCVCDPVTGEVVDKVPEYTTMSRRPGIGRAWFDKFKAEVYPADEVIVRGRSMKPPKFYDGIYEVLEPDASAAVSRARFLARSLEDETPERLSVREVCAEARLNRLPRTL